MLIWPNCFYENFKRENSHCKVMTQSVKYTLINKGSSKKNICTLNFKFRIKHLKNRIKKLNISCAVSLIYFKYFKSQNILWK